MSEFKVIVEKEKVLERAEVFVSGFHGLGSVGYLTLKTVIDELNLERVAVLQSPAAPPFISLTESGRLALAFEFYATKDGKILFFFPRLPPYRHLETEFSNLLAQWVIKKPFKQAILIGGVDRRLKENLMKTEGSDSNIRYIPTKGYLSSNSKFNKEIEKNLLPTGLYVQGPLAVLLANFDVHHFPGIGILAFAERDRPDPEGAANAIMTLNKMFGINCPVEELLKNAKLFEEEILKNANIFPTQDDSGPPETYT